MKTIFQSLWPFKKTPPTKVKRDFTNAPWKWMSGPSVRDYHVFSFTNALGVVVFKDSSYTFDGMEARIITDFDGETFQLFIPPADLKIYNHVMGQDVEQVRVFCDMVRGLRKWDSKNEVK